MQYDRMYMFGCSSSSYQVISSSQETSSMREEQLMMSRASSKVFATDEGPAFVIDPLFVNSFLLLCCATRGLISDLLLQ